MRKKPQRKLHGNYTFTFYESMMEVDKTAWSEVLLNSNFFLSTDYLQVIEDLHKPQIAHRYAIVYQNKKPVFVCCFQVIDFTADVFGELVESQITDLTSKRLKLFDKYLDKYKDHVVMRVVTCGNNFVSGEHCFAYSQKIKREDAFFILEKITAVVSKEEKLRGTISATLIKDFYANHLPAEKVLAENKFIEFTVEPNMTIEMPENTGNLDEYIALFSKKYRNRAKHIFKAGAQLTRKNLSAEEIKTYEKQMYKLYENVFMHAKFKLVKLAENYFHEMKKSFRDMFFVTGYFLENKLVGFDSGYYLPDDIIEAHYIGVDYEINKEHELYQNILYHFIELALTTNKKHLNLGRTASEIKSTVGAKANQLVCYIKPQNTVSKVVLNPFISFLQPTEWVPRNPFKEE
ncbi:MAG TPA: hypothetical protein VKG26_06800 [Bacteroidia bacterium]|nr:hypothetical protein [Bacteroidia bacterium]